MIRKLSFALLPLAVLLLTAEIGVRVASIDVRAPSGIFPINKDITFADIYELDHDLFWRFRPNQDISSSAYSAVTYHINSFGLRGSEPRPDFDFRILAIGNSCTFGWAVREQYIWTTVLESNLNEKQGNNRYQVINAGVPGYSSHQGRIFCSRLLTDFKPQYVCIMFGWNDHWAAGDKGSDREVLMPNSFMLRLINALSPLKSFQLARKLTSDKNDAADKVTINTIEGLRRVPIEQFRENLGALIDSALAYSATPLLMVPPIAPDSLTSPALQSLHRQYQGIIRDVAAARHVTCVDLQAAFDSAGNLFPVKQDPVHFGVEGHRLVAQRLLEVIHESSAVGGSNVLR